MGIEPSGTDSQQIAESTRKCAKSLQKQAFTDASVVSETTSNSRSLQIQGTNQADSSTQRLYGTTNTTNPLPDDLAKVVAVWSELSDVVKAEILKLIDTDPIR